MDNDIKLAAYIRSTLNIKCPQTENHFCLTGHHESPVLLFSEKRPHSHKQYDDVSVLDKHASWPMILAKKEDDTFRGRV